MLKKFIKKNFIFNNLVNDTHWVMNAKQGVNYFVRVTITLLFIIIEGQTDR